jgi:hypothetical protein
MGLNLIGKIELDGAGFERGLHRATEHVTDFVKHATIAAFGFYGVEEAIKKTVESASELVNTSKRLDVTIEQLQILKQSAKDGGTELDMMAATLEKIDVARGKVMRGGLEGANLLRSFERLGVNEQMLQTQTAASLLMGPISGTVKNENPENISLQLKDILGKGFGALLPTLKTGFEEVGDKLRKFGLITDTLTAVKLKNMGDEFDLVGKVITTFLGPTLVKFGEFILNTIAHSKILESVDFIAKRNEELGKIPDFVDSHGVSHSADIRNQAADDFRTRINKAMSDKEPFEKFREHWKFAFDGIFQDFKGGSYKDFISYLSKVSEPSVSATQNAAKASDADMSGLQKMVADWQDQMTKAADALDHPMPINPESDDVTPTKLKKDAPSDALVKVGNFLGANGSTISRANQEKINLLRTIARNTGHASFGSRPSMPDRKFDLFGIQIPQV